VRWWHWPAFPPQKLFCFVKVSRSYVYMKIVFLFFLLITHWCGAPASWAARHTTVCLDLKLRDHWWYYNKILYHHAPLSCLLVYQLSRELDNAFVFYNNFHTFTKRRKKNQKSKPIFKGSNLGNIWCDLVEIWNVRWLHLVTFPLQKLFCFVKVSRRYVHVKNCVIVLPVNN